jgi:HAE1 family hydrophobic/amphiphilic exporter-1
MVTVAVLLFGSVALSRLNVNLLPDLAHPALTIRTELEGSAPAEVENLITKPVEEALGIVKNVEEVRSVSRTGQSDVILEFGWGTDMDVASLEVREKLDAIDLPLEVQRPTILRFDPSLDPIMRFGLAVKEEAGPGDLLADASPGAPAASATFDERSLKYLRRLADEEIKRTLEASAGVAAVKVSGGLEDEVQVHVDPERLGRLGLSIDRVVQVLGAENVNLSGGRLEEGTQQYLMRTLNQFQSVAEIEDVVLSAGGTAPIYVRDVATVRMGYRERETVTRIDGREAVEVAIYKEGDANTVAVADAVASRLDRLTDRLPEDVDLVPVYDQSVFISSAIDEVVTAGLIGGLLAVLVLYFFLRDLRTTLIIGLTIPVSVVATFNLMYGADLTLNVMSLGGLALGIGLLVDNAIVVLENIARHREEGKAPLAAARDGTGEVGMAVAASTLTTVAVFGPLVFVDGIAGQLFRDQALTVTFSLLASLVVALTLIPMLASLGGRSTSAPETRDRAGSGIPWPRRPSPKRLRVRMRRSGWTMAVLRAAGFGLRHVPWALGVAVTALTWGIGRLGTLLVRDVVGRGLGVVVRPLLRGFQRGYEAVAAPYPRLLRAALRHRVAVLAVAFGLLAGSVALIPQIGVELIPQLAQNEFTVEMELPPGTPIEETDAVLAQMQRAAAPLGAVQTTFAVAGTGTRMDANPDQGGENWGELHVALAPHPGAERTATDALRQTLDRLPGAQYTIRRPTLFTFDTPIEVEIAGYDLDHLKTTAEQVAQRMRASDRFADVSSTMEQGHPEVQIHFDRERAAALGLAVHDVADRVVSQVRGDVATRYSWRDRKIDVRVRARAQDRASIEQIEQLVVSDGTGANGRRAIPLKAVADVVVDVGPSEIRRSSQERVVLVTANLRRGDLGAAEAELATLLAGVPLPTGLSARLTGQSEEMSDSFRSLLFALALAVFLVYLVMASQFESLLHPFVIFFSIPLAAVGAIWALWLTGTTISVVVFIGLILLAGIVVNNAIVLVDLINQLRAQGMDVAEAVVEGGRLRLRPILMTTLTTTLGLLPLALGWGEGAELRTPMAVPVIGGLVVSTLLTLVVIPILYTVFDRSVPAGADG